MVTFEELTEKRRLLQDICELHYPSIEVFNAGLSYKREMGEEGIGLSEAKHLTSSVTCFGSLLECPDRFRPSLHPDLIARSRQYADAAIELPPDRWKSDESASIYCRCRALPFVVRNVSEWHDDIAVHVETIFKQMIDEPTRFALGEADPAMAKGDWYPPNAYHTYWTLLLLSDLRYRFDKKYNDLDSKLRLGILAEVLQEWARKSLAYQVSLHSAKSSVLDSDQLAWSLAIVIGFSQRYQANLAEQDFLRQAFRCLFETQTDVGSWRHYAPLFHYKKTGNAYCYVFETFAVLLKCALRPGAEFIRTVLKHHFAELLKLWQYARSTEVPVEQPRKAIIWSSGHRMNNLSPESWATASVFSYAQGLRRLVGIWTRESALFSLPRRNNYSSRESAEKQLQERTQTWTSGVGLAEQLWTMFVNHLEPASIADELEPDNLPIGRQYARSAILYGPPGSSKTTIVRALAGVIGWDYVELHASHFVADGLPNVQRTANEIFRRLMELDRAIVLFDEIDEDS